MVENQTKNRLDLINREPSTRHADWFLWRRFSGRLVDFLFWLAVWYPAGQWLSRRAVHHNLALFLLDQVVACALMMATEPLQLVISRTTIGKALFGLRVSDGQGARLTIKNAYHRAFFVWRFALGFGLPFYRLVMLGRAYAEKRSGQPVCWENETLVSPLRFG
ncbi:MAG: RDD family protein [Clostridiaceae bacterium]|nr:RDD family protein [Clostridiaceae bacterium]